MVFGYLLQFNVDTPLRVPSKNTERDEKWKEQLVLTRLGNALIVATQSTKEFLLNCLMIPCL